MEVIFFPEVEQNMNDVYLFCYRRFGKRVAQETRLDIRRQILLLGPNPHLGPMEPLLSHRPESWRSLVVHPHLKAIYLVGSQTVNIAALWDTRRNPATMANYLDRLIQAQPTVACEPTIPYQRTSKKG